MVCLFAAFQFILLPLHRKIYSIFWVMSVVGYAIVCAELLYSRILEYRKPISFDLKHIRQKKWQEHFIYHLFLPSLLYISGILFLFFNRQRLLDQAAIVILSGCFMILFYNISTSYRKLYSVSKNTRYIFDVINIIVFYFCTDVLVNLVLYHGLPFWIVYVGAGLLGAGLIYMMIFVARQKSREVWIALGITVLVLAVTTWLVWMVPAFNVAVMAIVVTVIFYLADVYWHHKLEGTFTMDTFYQYLLFAVMAIILLMYL